MAKVAVGKGIQRQTDVICHWMPIPMATFSDGNLLPSETFYDGKGCQWKKMMSEMVDCHFSKKVRDFGFLR